MFQIDRSAAPLVSLRADALQNNGPMTDSQHARITAELRDRIGSGRLAPGTAVASEAELAVEFAVSRGTVRQALAGLRAEGLISGGRGRRPVVARPAVSEL